MELILIAQACSFTLKPWENKQGCCLKWDGGDERTCVYMMAKQRCWGEVCLEEDEEKERLRMCVCLSQRALSVCKRAVRKDLADGRPVVAVRPGGEQSCPAGVNFAWLHRSLFLSACATRCSNAYFFWKATAGFTRPQPSDTFYWCNLHRSTYLAFPPHLAQSASVYWERKERDREKKRDCASGKAPSVLLHREGAWALKLVSGLRELNWEDLTGDWTLDQIMPVCHQDGAVCFVSAK